MSDAEVGKPLAQKAERFSSLSGAFEDHRTGLAELYEKGEAALAVAPESFEKGRLRQLVWKIRKRLVGSEQYFSEAGQDELLDRAVFRQARGGVFVEIGAFDGLVGSNTLFFEMCRGWTGLLVEASPRLRDIAAQRRRNPCLCVAVGAETGEAEFLDVSRGYEMMGGLVEHLDPRVRQAIEAHEDGDARVVRVPTRPLADILKEHGLTRIDYLSIDVEGAEPAILAGFPFDEFDIKVWSIEVRGGRDHVAALMTDAGYGRIAFVGHDQIFVKKNAIRTPS